MRFGRGAGLLVATALAMSGLSACGDESEPANPTTTASPIDKGTDSPSETSSSSDDASGSSTDDVPAAAQEKTKAGAVAFTKLWFEEAGDALQNGDDSWIRAHAHTGCAPCNALAEGIKKDESDGVVADRDPISVEDATAAERPDDGYRVEFTMKNPAYSMVDENGSVVRRFEQIRITVVTDTHWDGGQWILKDWLTK